MRATAVLVPLLLVLAVVLIVAAVRPQPEPAGRAGPRLSIVRRRTSRWRWAGVALGMVLAGVALQFGGALGRGLMVAGPLFALGILTGVITGELRVAAPTRAARSAPLEVRRVRDYVPRRLAVAVALGTVTLGALLLTTTALGSPDDLGRAGRWLVQACSEASTQGRGPWPGLFYSLPLAMIVLGGLVAAAAALQQVVRRPRQGEDTAVDDTLRRHAASAVVAASGILVTVPLAGVGSIAGIALLGITCPPWWMPVLGWSLVALVPLAAALAVWSTAVLAMPARVSAGHEVR
jgi:hypothetical protein